MAKILLVEDHSDTRDLIRIVLESDGHTVAEAVTGEDALKLAKQFEPQLILMDISLAGNINGLEAARRLRADSSFDRTIILALTAHAMKQDKEPILAAGCDEYWTKPILDFGLFKNMISDSIRRGRITK